MPLRISIQERNAATIALSISLTSTSRRPRKDLKAFRAYLYLSAVPFSILAVTVSEKAKKGSEKPCRSSITAVTLRHSVAASMKAAPSTVAAAMRMRSTAPHTASSSAASLIFVLSRLSCSAFA